MAVYTQTESPTHKTQAGQRLTFTDTHKVSHPRTPTKHMKNDRMHTHTHKDVDKYTYNGN